MRVFRSIPPSAATGGIALTIGNFDGVHLGHQAMVRQLTSAARQRRLASAVMIFEPQPREFFAPERAPARLTNLREKLELLGAAGVEQILVCRFNRAFAQMSATVFMHDVLQSRLATRWLLVGDDFRFGADRAGDYALLVAHAPHLGIELVTMTAVEVDGKRVSSTLVREALASGDLKSAQRYLGRPYSIAGRVVHGDKIGRTLGFPTANVALRLRRPPVAGVFAVKLRTRGVAGSGAGSRPVATSSDVYAGVASLGTRPTLTADGKPQLEVYLFDFSGDLYGRYVQVDFLHKLRDEVQYPDLASLTAQIARDAADARTYLAKVGN